MNNITIVILTKNEEHHIVDVVENAKRLTKHILVIDSGSTDATVTLAQEHGANVKYRVWDNDFSAQRNFALEYVETEWVLYLDADERMSEELIAEIKTFNKPAMYRFIRKNSAFGRDFNYGVLGPDSVVRLFPVGMAKWTGKVHEGLKSELSIVNINRGYIKHYTYGSFEQYLYKMNKYSSIGAVDKRNQGKHVSLIGDLIFRPLFAFLKMYILKGGFLEGWLGFVLSVSYANYTLNKYVKLKMME